MEKNQTELIWIVDPLLQWYDCQARVLPWREEASAYRVWISEIMLQQTRVEAVKPYFERFIRELPGVKELAQVSEEKLLKLWEGLGYYNRARNLQKAAITMMESFEGKLPSSYQELSSLSGIGAYTAGAIASIAFQIPVPAVDGNVLRVYTRLLALKEDITKKQTKDSVQNEIQRIIPKNRPGDFNQALMELGAMVCLPNGIPKCAVCPVQKYCKAYETETVLDYPVKAPKKARKKETRQVFFFFHQNMAAVQRRGKKGLLAGLWEFPNIEIEGECSEEERKVVFQEWDIIPVRIIELGKAKHIFTHIQWDMNGYAIEVMEKNNLFEWVQKEELERKITLPSAFKFYYEKGIALL